MRKLGLVLLIALAAGCVTPDPKRALRTPDPVEVRPPDPVIALLAQILYLLGSWLGPKT